MADKEPGPEPLPKTIVVGDRIKLNPERRGPYRQAYAIPDDATWVVVGQSFVGGKRRLHVEGTPTLIWAMDAKCVHTWQQKERREQLEGFRTSKAA